MADEQKKASAGESFAGSVLKFSVATYLGFIISGVAIVVQGILGPEKTGLPAQFMNTTATLMYLGILGLDQALLRFYHEPPAGCTGRGLFSACTRLSVAFMAVLGVGGSVLFGSAIARATGFASRRLTRGFTLCSRPKARAARASLPPTCLRTACAWPLFPASPQCPRTRPGRTACAGSLSNTAD